MRRNYTLIILVTLMFALPGCFLSCNQYAVDEETSNKIIAAYIAKLDPGGNNNMSKDNVLNVEKIGTVNNKIAVCITNDIIIANSEITRVYYSVDGVPFNALSCPFLFFDGQLLDLDTAFKQGIVSHKDLIRFSKNYWKTKNVENITRDTCNVWDDTKNYNDTQIYVDMKPYEGDKKNYSIEDFSELDCKEISLIRLPAASDNDKICDTVVITLQREGKQNCFDAISAIINRADIAKIAITSWYTLD